MRGSLTNRRSSIPGASPLRGAPRRPRAPRARHDGQSHPPQEEPLARALALEAAAAWALRLSGDIGVGLRLLALGLFGVAQPVTVVVDSIIAILRGPRIHVRITVVAIALAGEGAVAVRVGLAVQEHLIAVVV